MAPKVDVAPMRLTRVLTWMTALLFAAMAWHSWPLQPGIPLLQLTFTEGAFRAVVNQWSSADLARFHDHFFWDFPYLVCYGMWGWVLVQQSTWFRSERGSKFLPWAWCTPLASGLDALENIMHLHLVFTPGPFHPAEYAVAGGVSSAKWVLLLVFGMKLVLVLLTRRGSTHG
jgi:hypothetical protein